MTVRILIGDARERLKELPDESVHCVVTSPPYWGLRDYGVAGQLGLEDTPEGFVEAMRSVFAEARRVLRHDGTVWLNLGDSYASNGRANYGFTDPNSKQATHATIKSVPRREQPPGLKAKDLVGIPWRVAFALQADGWYLRQDIIWSKPNPMPESVRDRCTKAHEYLFLLSKSERYYYDADAIREPISASTIERWNGAPIKKRPDGLGTPSFVPGENTCGVNPDGRNKRSVWEIATSPYSEAHFATFPPALIEPCIKAGCQPLGTVLDPFGGAGTTALVADRLQRNAILIELNPEYAAMAARRIRNEAGVFADVQVESSSALAGTQKIEPRVPVPVASASPSNTQDDNGMRE